MDERTITRAKEVCGLILDGRKVGRCQYRDDIKCTGENCYVFEILELGRKDCEIEMEAAGFRQE